MSRKKSTVKMVRVQFDIPEDKIHLIDKLVPKTDSNTRKEVVSMALALLEWAVREAEMGKIIASVDEAQERYKELYMPLLSKA